MEKIYLDRLTGNYLILSFLTMLLTFTVSGAGPLFLQNPTQQIIYLPEGSHLFSQSWLFAMSDEPITDELAFSLFDMNGQKYFSGRPDLSENGTIRLLDASGKVIQIPPGLYFYQLEAATNPWFSGQDSTPYFIDIGTTHLPPDSTDATMVESALLNDDPFPDFVLGFFNDPAQPRLLINNGNGFFFDETAIRLPQLSIKVNDLTAVDIDDDGDLDLFFACSEGIPPPGNSDVLLLNDGQGIFTDISSTHLPSQTSGSNSVDWGFVNNDEFPDLIVTGMLTGVTPAENHIFIYVNDGSGMFQLLPAAAIQAGDVYGAFDAVFADVNQDRLTDFILGCIPIIGFDSILNPVFLYSGQNAVFVQDSSGIFHDQTAQRMPLMERSTRLIKLRDINNDGAPDFYAVNTGFDATGATNVLYVNNGHGYFQDETVLRLPPETDLWNNDAEFDDFDENGFADLFLVNVRPGEPAYDNLYLNSSGYFQDASTHLPPVLDFNVSSVLGDIEVDMDNDIYISVTGGVVGEILPDRLYQNMYLAVNISKWAGHQTPGIILLSNYPNPFNSRTMVTYEIPRTAPIEIFITDLFGRLVRQLYTGYRQEGMYQVLWDGRDEQGTEVASGIYICQVKGDRFFSSVKMMLLR